MHSHFRGWVGSGEMRLKLKTINQARRLRDVERDHGDGERSKAESRDG